jgi:ribosomal protein S18 acetylase RimI-like enzyme
MFSVGLDSPMVEIRKAIQDDVSGIAKVHVDTWRSTYQDIVPASFLESLSYSKRGAMWTDVIKRNDPNSHVFVAIDDAKQVVGFTAGGPSREKDYPYDGELYAIYLLKEHQGQGIGRRLFQATTAHLSSRQLKGMMLWVLEENATKRFYEAMGGVSCGEKTIEIGGKALKEIAYGWTRLAD